LSDAEQAKIDAWVAAGKVKKLPGFGQPGLEELHKAQNAEYRNQTGNRRWRKRSPGKAGLRAGV
jgi:hypothetical protein